MQWVLLKFLQIQLMTSQDRFLLYLVSCWDADLQLMVIHHTDLPILAEIDIYVVTSLMP